MEQSITPKTTTTLEELLADKDLASSGAKTQYDENQECYCKCLKEFLMGDQKKCLEEMLSCNLLNPQTLHTDFKVWKLFVSACRDAKLDDLGQSVVKVIRSSFADPDFSTYDRLLEMEPLSERIAGKLAFLECSFKVNKLDDTSRSMGLLDQHAKDLIRDSCGLVQTSEDAKQLYNLVVFYIFYIKVQGMRMRISLSLYTSLCDEMPLVRDVLRGNPAGPEYALPQDPDYTFTMETCISNQLKGMVEKKKAKYAGGCQTNRRKSQTIKSSQTPRQELPLATSARPNETSSSSKNTESQVSIRFTLSWIQSYCSKLWSLIMNGNFAPIAVLAVIFTLKYAKMLKRFNKTAPKLTKRLWTLLDFLMNI
ncbi:LADA_0F07074g1_1 [Lachancea dasiensis]|uniref:LADA_0F07074g1_1 n=1 Tax=Lachancea dasiensis TaxID=1072105 RepID=A0A1G4JKC8_9SACH|nr:LADA_0F07074g1_1 [Lachancea dasiensis]